MMIEDLLEEAGKDCLCRIVSDIHSKLLRVCPEMADELEDDLYEGIHGRHMTAWTYKKASDSLVDHNGRMGPHWDLDQVRSLMKSKGTRSDDWNEYDLAYAMNMLWSDYSKMVGDEDAIFRMALAFLDDPDGPDGKAYLYWRMVSSAD